jgi:hypothetical protein
MPSRYNIDILNKKKTSWLSPDPRKAQRKAVLFVLGDISVNIISESIFLDFSHRFSKMNGDSAALNKNPSRCNN